MSVVPLEALARTFPVFGCLDEGPHHHSDQQSISDAMQSVHLRDKPVRIPVYFAMSETLVITCPGGKQCSRLIPLVYDQGRFHLRLAAHSRASVDRLKIQYPKAEIVAVDLQSSSDCRKLLHGATAINAVLPSLHSREREIGISLVDAAVAESMREGNVFKHFVFSSVLCTQHRSLLQHDLKSYVEESLFLSPLTCWTILKPTNVSLEMTRLVVLADTNALFPQFMNTYPVVELAGMDKPVLEKWWAPQQKNSLINLEDLAEATAKVLLEREVHYLAEYSLCSTMPISETEIVDIISRRIGKKVEVKIPAFEDGVQRLSQVLFGSSIQDTNLRLAPTGDLEEILYKTL